MSKIELLRSQQSKKLEQNKILQWFHLIGYHRCHMNLFLEYNEHTSSRNLIRFTVWNVCRLHVILQNYLLNPLHNTSWIYTFRLTKNQLKMYHAIMSAPMQNGWVADAKEMLNFNISRALNFWRVKFSVFVSFMHKASINS